MSQVLVVEVTDDRLIIGEQDINRPKALQQKHFAAEMGIWLGAHEDTGNHAERKRRRQRVSSDFLLGFGRKLFDAILAGAGYGEYRNSRNALVALSLPEDLRGLPWELMHDGELWVARTRGLVRLTEGTPGPTYQALGSRLRVLALMAAPALNPALDAGHPKQPYMGDVESYASIFRSLEGGGFPADFTIVRHATLDDLRTGMDERPDILYFDGHGISDGEGIVFDDGHGRTRAVNRFTLRERLQSSTVRLAVTNSCCTAEQCGRGDPVAALLVRAGMPIAIGMQTPISDPAAQCFAHAFFGSLGKGTTPVAAIARARQALDDAHPKNAEAWEWAVPAVYVSRDAVDASLTPMVASGTGTAAVRDEVRQKLRAEPGAGAALPTRPARFVGRHQEIVDSLDGLSQTQVTILHGLRGVGKTTLALEVAGRASRNFDRIVWVRARVEGPSEALGGAMADPMVSGRLGSADELIARVADGLGIRGLAGPPLLAAINRELDAKPTLIVLDNLDSFTQKGEFAGTTVLPDLLATLPISTRALLTVAGELEVAGRRVSVEGLLPELGGRLAHFCAQEMGLDLTSDEADLIGASTGGHPMAIRYAVGVIGRKGTREQVLDGLRARSGMPIEEVLHYVMGEAVASAPDDAKLLFKLSSMFPTLMHIEVLYAGSLWADRNRFERALEDAFGLMLLELVDEGRSILLQELPRAEAGRLDFELPERSNHGAAMVRWAREAKDEILFCDLVSAWEVYCSQRGHLAEWVPAGREAVELAERIGDRRRERVARNDLGAWCIRTGNLSEGVEHFTRCADLATEDGDEPAEASALGNMGNIHIRRGDLERALECFQKAYDIAERLNSPQTMANALGNMGLIHAQQGDLERALECHQKAYDIDLRLGNPQGQAEDLGNMGLIYADQGELERALECHQKAYDIAERLNSPETMANALGNMGNIHIQRGELERALECYQKAYDIAERLNSPQTMANTLGNMGLIHAQRGELERALECHQKAYDIAERLNSPQTMANQLGNIGLIHAQRGELERALECHQKAYDIAERLNSPETMANQLGNMGNIYIRRGELERALECYQKAYDIADQLNSPQTMAGTLGNMGNIHAQQGELERAREYLERARELYHRVGIKGQGPEAVARSLELVEEMQQAKAREDQP